jgi:hypothetical protein
VEVLYACEMLVSALTSDRINDDTTHAMGSSAHAITICAQRGTYQRQEMSVVVSSNEAGGFRTKETLKPDSD